jgi:uncharacterized protein YkwD
VGNARVQLVGQALQSYENLRAMITHGPFGYARCERDRAVALPRFSFSCPLGDAHEAAWIEVAGFEAGRFFGDGLVLYRHRPAGASAQYITPSRDGAPALTASAAPQVAAEPEAAVAAAPDAPSDHGSGPTAGLDPSAPEPGASETGPANPCAPAPTPPDTPPAASPMPVVSGAPTAPPTSPAVGAGARGTEIFAEVVQRIVNRWRARAGLREVDLEQNQSGINDKAAPHYWPAAFGGSSGLAMDAIAMGLMAGWEVNGSVLQGHFASQWQSYDADPEVLIETMLQMPLDRETLLNPKIERLAVGSVHPEGGVGAVITTYELFAGIDRQATTARVVNALNAARAAKKLPPVRVNAKASAEVEAGAVAIEDPRLDPNNAIEGINTRIVSNLRIGVLTWTMPILDFDDIDFPEDLLNAPIVEMGVSVAFYRDAESPWGRYYVLVSILQLGGSA